MAEEKTLDEAAKPKAAGKEVTFVCETKCYWNEVLYHEGDTITISESLKDKVPEHFTKKVTEK